MMPACLRVAGARSEGEKLILSGSGGVWGPRGVWNAWQVLAGWRELAVPGPLFHDTRRTGLLCFCV